MGIVNLIFRSSIISFISKISFRIMIFNLLLIFLPLAGIMYLDVYEKQLLQNQEDSMVQQGRIVAAALSQSTTLDKQQSEALLVSLNNRNTSRIRIIDTEKKLITDSSTVNQTFKEDKESLSWRPYDTESEYSISSHLYKIFTGAVRIYRRIVPPDKPYYEEADYYSSKLPFTGSEVLSALSGKYGATTRVSRNERSVVLYIAIPITHKSEVTGAVLVSKSTYSILKDLYEIRRNILTISAASILMAILLSLIASVTITSPLKKLKKQAHSIVYQRGRLSGSFKAESRYDEIGDLAHSLAGLTCRLENHIHYIESLSADISHEFKNPLASIKAAAEILQTEDDPEGREKFSGIIAGGVTRMERLLSGLKELTSIERSVEDEQEEECDIHTLCTRLIESYKLRFRNITYTDLSSRALFIHASTDRIAQAIENLIDNAINFCTSDDAIEVIIQDNKDTIYIIVSDTGPGIPVENLDTIFNRFFSYRPHNNRNQHTGLGLAIVKSIIESYNGRITACNNPEGGARFTISFQKTKGNLC